jgi:uncharacterized protein YqgC (DUF456 family)
VFVLLFALALLGCLLLIPVGLPGIWLMLAAAIAYGALTGTALSTWALGTTLILALVAEVVEFFLGSHMARKFGGSRRSAWGALLGGLAGALLLSPLPVLGPMTGGFVGAFAGAWVGEWSVNPSADAATRTATGALIGRIAAVAIKIGMAMASGVVLLTAAVWLAQTGMPTP